MAALSTRATRAKAKTRSARSGPARPTSARNGSPSIRVVSTHVVRRAGLRYIMDGAPGFYRQRRGRGFVYVNARGRIVRDAAVLRRIRALVIPPAWRDVWICPVECGHLQATGRDARGRKQYRYHATWCELRNRSKYDRLVEFALTLPRIWRRTDRDLRRRALGREKVLAAVVRLLEQTTIRVGNAEYARDNESFGLTTLRNNHVDVSGTRISFRFRGKSGREHQVTLHDPRLARIVQNCREIPGQELFKWTDAAGAVHDVESGDVNDYIRQISGRDFTAKDFRTWAGTFQAARELTALGECTARTATGRRLEAKRKLAECTRRVAERLGNRPATCRKYYIHPAIFEAFETGGLVAEMRAAAQRPGSGSTYALTAEQAAVVGVLRSAGEATRSRTRAG